MMFKSMMLGATAVALFASGGVAQAQTRMQADAVEAPAVQFLKFAPHPDRINTRLDFSIWDEALEWFVLRMGSSLRERAPKPEPMMGSRMVFGHDSGYRLEGNRVAFSYMTAEVIQSLTDYRRDLEELPDRVALNRLPRNEQLAYWMNLHNVAVIEQIALNYPVGRPIDIKLGESNLPLDEAPFITVSGVKMSPKDIRTKVVYPNWNDPKVMYGFWRGEIGGPSIERKAFSGENVGELLSASAKEFINSLRGAQKTGSTLAVSSIYREAQPFLFPDWPADVRKHLQDYAEPEVMKLLEATSVVEARIEERDIADLSKGEREPSYNSVVSNDQVSGTLVDGAIARLLNERREKIEKMFRRGDLSGRVTVIDVEEKQKAQGEVE